MQQQLNNYQCGKKVTHLKVDYDLQVHCLLFLQPLDSTQRDPQVVSIEDLELRN